MTIAKRNSIKNKDKGWIDMKTPHESWYVHYYTEYIHRKLFLLQQQQQQTKNKRSKSESWHAWFKEKKNNRECTLNFKTIPLKSGLSNKKNLPIHIIKTRE